MLINIYARVQLLNSNVVLFLTNVGSGSFECLLPDLLLLDPAPAVSNALSLCPCLHFAGLVGFGRRECLLLGQRLLLGKASQPVVLCLALLLLLLR